MIFLSEGEERCALRSAGRVPAASFVSSAAFPGWTVFSLCELILFSFTPASDKHADSCVQQSGKWWGWGADSCVFVRLESKAHADREKRERAPSCVKS